MRQIISSERELRLYFLLGAYYLRTRQTTRERSCVRTNRAKEKKFQLLLGAKSGNFLARGKSNA